MAITWPSEMKTNKETIKNEEERKERSRSNYSELPEDDNLPAKGNKKEQGKNKENKEGRGLRKSKSQKDKNDPDRFNGDGICFKAKIIGIDNVGDARGNKMCQDALQRLKASVKSSGEHKQRITLNISLNGIKIKDEKSGVLLHHHPVHKISFISQDTNDNRAFGYVFGCPQTGHQFFAIKTEKTASHVVFTLRDLFQVALKLKKKEIERAMELQKDAQDTPEQPSILKNKSMEEQNDSVCHSSCSNQEKSIDVDEKLVEPQPLYFNALIDDTENQSNDTNTANDTNTVSALVEPTGVVSAIDNLLDLQFEVDNLQQGITQMEYSIASTASLNFGVSFSEDDNSLSSGNSFVTTPRKCDRLSSLYQENLSLSSRSSSTSDYNAYSQESKNEDLDAMPKSTEVFAVFSLTSPLQSSGILRNSTVIDDKCIIRNIADMEDRYTIQNAVIVNDTTEDMGDDMCTTETTADDKCVIKNSDNVDDRYAVFLDIDSIPSIFDNPKIVPLPEYDCDKITLESSEGEHQKNNLSDDYEASDVMKPSGSLLFAELDPLGFQPYVDKKDFFHELKNPPKKVLKDLVGDGADTNNSIFESELAFPVSHLNGAIEEPNITAISCNPFMTSSDIKPTSPPKLPPKRSPGISSPLPVYSDESVTHSEEVLSDIINPFNPFVLSDSTPDIPPPCSPPPPPPPPRLPSKVTEHFFITSSPPPPPRPPSRTCTPTPPLPRRKVSLNSANKTWYSFDQDTACSWSISVSPVNQESSVPLSPPLPLPSRKLPLSNKFDSTMLKSSSACSSPAAMRKVRNSSPLFYNSISNSELPEVFVANGVSPSPRKMLSRHSSVTQDWTESSVKDFSTTSAIKYPFLEPNSSSSLKDTVFSGQTVARSPPLLPKCISRPRPSPSKKMFSVRSMSQSSSNSSVTESTTESQSTSSLRYKSLEDSRDDSTSEILYRNSTDSQSEDAFHVSSNSDVKEQNESSGSLYGGAATSISPTSPDSIFRRKSDPFADDFFLSLPKKVSNGSASTGSISSQVQCTNGFNAESKEDEVPTYSQINKFKKEIS